MPPLESPVPSVRGRPSTGYHDCISFEVARLSFVRLQVLCQDTTRDVADALHGNDKTKAWSATPATCASAASVRVLASRQRDSYSQCCRRSTRLEQGCAASLAVWNRSP